MQRSINLTYLSVCLLLIVVGAACTSGPAEAQSGTRSAASDSKASAQATEFGQPFLNVGTMKNVNAKSGAPGEIDVDAVIGTKPVLFYYWIAGNPRSDEMFKQIQQAVLEQGADKTQLYGLVFFRSPRDVAAVGDRVGKLEIQVPVLIDEEFRIGKRLRVQSVPNLTIIDAEGILRLTNGASLLQQLEYKIDLENAIERVARTGQLGTYGYLEAYFPVEELIGKQCPDFEAPLLGGDDAEKRWSSMLADDKVNVLIFWSVDCPHCRDSLPRSR